MTQNENLAQISHYLYPVAEWSRISGKLPQITEGMTGAVTMAGRQEMQGLIHGALAPEMRLPDMQPLTLTRNFLFVFVVCIASLAVVPVVVGWAASVLLK